MFYSFVKILLSVILRPFFRIRVYGLENIPLDNSLIICSNHRSVWDPVLISIMFPRQISWMAKKELFKNKFLAYIITKLTAFPVDRDGSDLGAIKKALRILKDDRVLGMFPEGTRVQSLDLDNAKSGIALLAFKSKSPVLPIYINSTYKIFSRVSIYIGEAIDLNDGVEGKLTTDDYLELSKQILIKIYNLEDNVGDNNEDNHS